MENGLVVPYRKLVVLVKIGENSNLGGRFGYFLFFSAPGRGKGESEAKGGGGADFLLKIPGRGVSRRERGRGGGRVSGRIGEFGGGGEIYFFSGPKCPPSNIAFYPKNKGFCSSHPGNRRKWRVSP